MKKGWFCILAGVFLFSGSLLAVRALGFGSTGKTGGRESGAKISNGARPTPTDAGSLPGALQSVLSKTLGASDPQYRVSRSGDGYRAVNGRNRFTTKIGLHGFTVSAGGNGWGLRLTAWGLGSDLQKVEAGRVVSGSNRVAVKRRGMVAWWVNGPLGLEQGWTVAHRPNQGERRGQLTLVLEQSGNLRTEALSHGRSLAVANKAGRHVLRYTGLTAYDKNGRQLPAHFEATRQQVRVVVDDSNAAYPVRIDPWVQAANLTASDGVAGDYLGFSVVVSSDGTTVVAGAINAMVGKTEGAVYVFKEPASGWASGTQAAKLTESDPTYGFGRSIAVSQDGTTVVAGAYQAGASPDVGQCDVYIFKEPASGWKSETETAKLTAPDGPAYAGTDVLVAVDSDGTTVVAGAPGATLNGSLGDGAVYVFEEPASGWEGASMTARLTPFSGTNVQLGASVAVSSDGTTVVAGALNGLHFNIQAPGTVYVFKRSASGWKSETETAKLTTSDGSTTDYLGWSVAVSSDGSAVAAGGYGTTVGNNSSQGAVYLFEMPVSGWKSETETARLTASDGSAYDDLGGGVAMSSDGATVAATSNYGIYVFKEPSSGWSSVTETAKLTGFYSSVAISSGAATIVAGWDQETVGNNGTQGGVDVFQGPFWSDALDFGNGWKLLSWFGNFNTAPSPWIYHNTLGWIYPSATSTASIWFWDTTLNSFCWTSATFYPFLYRASEGAWLYYLKGSSNPQWFFDYKAGGWVSY